MRLLVRIVPCAAAQESQPRKRKRDDDGVIQFAIPVEADESFELVWKRLEERYKRNYVGPEQAQCWGFQKIQDASFFDIDVKDRVGDIFDPGTPRDELLVHVLLERVDLPSSIPPTSSLQPTFVHARHSGSLPEPENKRRRMSQNYPTMDALASDGYPAEPGGAHHPKAENVQAKRRPCTSPILSEDGEDGADDDTGFRLGQNTTPAAQRTIDAWVPEPGCGVAPRLGKSSNLQQDATIPRTPRASIYDIPEDTDAEIAQLRLDDPSKEPLASAPAVREPSSADPTQRPVLDALSPGFKLSQSEPSALHQRQHLFTPGSPHGTPLPMEPQSFDISYSENSEEDPTVRPAESPRKPTAPLSRKGQTWTEEEDQLVINLYREGWTKEAIVGTYLPGRTVKALEHRVRFARKDSRLSALLEGVEFEPPSSTQAKYHQRRSSGGIQIANAQRYEGKGSARSNPSNSDRKSTEQAALVGCPDRTPSKPAKQLRQALGLSTGDEIINSTDGSEHVPRNPRTRTRVAKTARASARSGLQKPNERSQGTTENAASTRNETLRISTSAGNLSNKPAIQMGHKRFEARNARPWQDTNVDNETAPARSEKAKWLGAADSSHVPPGAESTHFASSSSVISNAKAGAPEIGKITGPRTSPLTGRTSLSAAVGSGISPTEDEEEDRVNGTAQTSVTGYQKQGDASEQTQNVHHAEVDGSATSAQCRFATKATEQKAHGKTEDQQPSVTTAPDTNNRLAKIPASSGDICSGRKHNTRSSVGYWSQPGTSRNTEALNQRLLDGSSRVGKSRKSADLGMESSKGRVHGRRDKRATSSSRHPLETQPRRASARIKAKVLDSIAIARSAPARSSGAFTSLLASRSSTLKTPQELARQRGEKFKRDYLVCKIPKTSQRKSSSQCQTLNPFASQESPGDFAPPSAESKRFHWRSSSEDDTQGSSSVSEDGDARGGTQEARKGPVMRIEKWEQLNGHRQLLHSRSSENGENDRQPSKSESKYSDDSIKGCRINQLAPRVAHDEELETGPSRTKNLDRWHSAGDRNYRNRTAERRADNEGDIAAVGTKSVAGDGTGTMSVKSPRDVRTRMPVDASKDASDTLERNDTNNAGLASSDVTIPDPSKTRATFEDGTKEPQKREAKSFVSRLSFGLLP